MQTVFNFRSDQDAKFASQKCFIEYDLIISISYNYMCRTGQFTQSIPYLSLFLLTGIPSMKTRFEIINGRFY
eukprot:g5101.t1